MNKLLDDVEQNKEILDDLLGVKYSFDIGHRQLIIQQKVIYLYYLNEMINSNAVMVIINNLLSLNKVKEIKNFFEVLVNNISHESLIYRYTFKEAYEDVLNGLLVILVENSNKIISVEVRSYPTRSISEPDMEKVIRGPHDGFTESLAINIALLRRRVKDGKLRNIIYEIGNNTKTNISLSYIENICDEKLISEAKSRIENINIPHLLMTDKALEEIILHQKINPYPLVRYTERADTVAVHLYQGMFAIFVDTSPSVILAPATFFDHLHHAEEYRQTPLAGTYLRLLRFAGVFISLFLTPLFLLLTKYPSYFPSFLGFLIPNKELDISIFFQLLLAEVGVEFLRMASIHTPSALSTAMGIIAGVLIGDVAIKVGLFSEIVVLLVALAAIGTYVTPSYELGLANKISKLFFLLMIYLFGFYGFIISMLLWIIYLSSLKSFKQPYFYPLIPFDFKRILKVLFRNPYKNKK